ncbi:tRNA (adenosine(37)-N6)-threonylcarbamoyltransferase complex dimerization subunit type 1 TsaB [Phreatobacter stygius]|uniref:tRNA (Adenosine(37)-N6)-threonylcarbamoyltransferase complex dimerization subunit type 1 TsaB n=1 Tax=Phreatobacter stygius TaxID=1940610 RepID=A0A4D7BAJ4_9HYPH|nr:tRNA (adenosine(37)-N6)-threonylcarbamoyltransferase complex dimerization subunit type 1 TsaB [Phreatobacter stygius]QCI65132.1 tRNA (adenosine(37)-N6)-threonylcarbamoyltransferase complex dimerization subunit type 1 TsaB [Phreatobacter stygius]
MLLLALDTALGASSAAILDTATDRVVARVSEPMDRGHAERLLPMVADLFAGAGLAPRDCRRFVATIGPGSFTGLRVAIAAARGMALAAGGDAVGISTLDALAAPRLAAADPGPVLSVIDARHGHVYAALAGADGGAILAPGYWPAAVAAAAAANHAAAIIGPGATVLLAAWPEGVPQPGLVEPSGFPDIGWVAGLGAKADPRTAPCRPLYLKEADAKPQVRSPLRPARAS